MTSATLGVKSHPLVHAKTGKKLTDEELCRESLKIIDDYEKKNKKAAPIAPNFKAWLKYANEQLDAGVPMQEIKDRTLLRDIDIEAQCQLAAIKK